LGASPQSSPIEGEDYHISGAIPHPGKAEINSATTLSVTIPRLNYKCQSASFLKSPPLRVRGIKGGYSHNFHNSPVPSYLKRGILRKIYEAKIPRRQNSFARSALPFVIVWDLEISI